jgi:hypothetical protein
VASCSMRAVTVIRFIPPMAGRTRPAPLSAQSALSFLFREQLCVGVVYLCRVCLVRLCRCLPLYLCPRVTESDGVCLNLCLCACVSVCVSMYAIRRRRAKADSRPRVQARVEPVHYLLCDPGPCDCGPDRVHDVGAAAAAAAATPPAAPGVGAIAASPTASGEVLAASLLTAARIVCRLARAHAQHSRS